MAANIELSMELIAKAAEQSGLVRTASCCTQPLKFCNGDEWEGNLEGFAKSLLRLAASAHHQQEPVAIYQMRHRDAKTVWCDVSEFVYRSTMAEGDKSKVRILYAQPPQPAQDAVDAAAVDRFIAFVDKVSWLNHPDVPFLGTVNGDSEEAWRRRMIGAALRAALQSDETKG